MKLAVVLYNLILLTQCYESRWSLQNLINIVSKTPWHITNRHNQIIKQKAKNCETIENIRNRASSVKYSSGTNQWDSTRRIKRNDADQTNNNHINKVSTITPNDFKFRSDDDDDDDPTIHMTTPQLLALHGFVAESHTVVTDDGYILTIHRIPLSKKFKYADSRKAVLLHHGLLGSSADWILPGPKKGLAYILSEAGYDVWMANVRGNAYSRAHVSKNTNTLAFWNFTFHEVSQYDLPAVIDYIRETKGWNAKINYIGHSMGTTVLFALLSTKTHYNKILNAGFALAPVAYMTDIKSPITLLAKYSDNIEFLLKLLGASEYFPKNSPILTWLLKQMCEITQYRSEICDIALFTLCGYDGSRSNKTLLPIILGHKTETSTKTLIHYGQEINKGGRFQQFDYGRDGNLEKYGRTIPPEYPLHKITLPIALLSAKNDWLASASAVRNLYKKLANPIEHYIVPLKEFNHIDFLWAVDAPKLVYRKLLQLLDDENEVDFNPKARQDGTHESTESDDSEMVNQTYVISLAK